MPPIRLAGPLALLCLFPLVTTHTQAALHLSEFMANNSESLADEDGDTSDWIELFNSGPGDINLDGYYLSDDEANKLKWRFPAVTLPEGEFMVVFASEKDRTNPLRELHTNFKLEKAGEYLGLHSPTGQAITEFGTAESPLPAQFDGVSYGLMQTGDRTATVLLERGDNGRVHVPATAVLGQTWTGINFDDALWTPVATGVGYDENSTYVPEFGAGGNLGDTLNGENTSLYIRMPFEVGNASSIAELTLRMKYDDGFVAFLNGQWIEDRNAPTPASLDYESEATANHSDGSAVSFQNFDITQYAHLLQDGVNVLAIQGLNDGLGSSDMLITPELHAEQITDPSIGGPGFLPSPSPGAFNGNTFDGFVADTKFSTRRGFFEAPFQLEITTATEGAEIRYTIDGTEPSSNRGVVYRGPIQINRTTVVRAMAHKDGFEPTNVDTNTYIFPTDVVNQPRMRTTITQSGQYGPQMLDSLKAVPTVSLVTTNTGFLNEGGSNIREEYASSVEMIFPDGREGFQENGGLSNYGGRFTNFRKKSFRMAFRSRFGKKRLKYPIFDEFQYKHYPPTDVFDAINLRSGSHDMRSRGAYMSNRFVDDSMLEMGNIAPHGRFVHVYLNGNYWGQYHLRERWNADMATSYFGGPEAEYEAVNANDNFRNDEEVYDGDGQFWEETKSLIAGSNPYFNAANHIDVANIVDFMLLWVSGDSESEFRAFGSESQGVPFKFMVKDADGYLRMPGSSKASHAGPRSVMSVMRNGANGPDFEMLVADRIHMHFFNNGALTPARNIERLRRRVDEARPGFVSEAARWGDVFREPSSWESYQSNLINNHFPQLANTMISRFKSAGMYPDIIAPVFSQHGGSVLANTPITMSTDATTIYYTTDGSDPRLPGGGVSPLALSAEFDGGQQGPTPITYLSSGSNWKFLDDGSDQGTAWRQTEYDDTTWRGGPSPLGYGGDGERTPVGFGPNDRQKYATTYYRTTIDVEDPSVFHHFLLRLKYDDGAAVYINGVERIRTPNLPAGAAYNTYTNGTTNAEDSWFDFEIPTSAFEAGVNTLAVEVHQGSGTSSDTRMDMILRGETSVGGGGDNVSDPIFFSSATVLRARAYNSGTQEWSALNEAFFGIDSEPASSSNLVLSELHYHPANPSTPAELAQGNDRDDFEFAEFLNIGDKAIDLTGVLFEEGINFSFPDYTLMQPGERLLLVRDRAAFEARYGVIGDMQVFEYTGRFSNDGEEVKLVGDALGSIIEFTYNDQLPWPTEADGEGPSMLLINPNDGPEHDEASNWRASRHFGGSPGEVEPSGESFVQWAARLGIESGPDGDDDRDGINNYLEYLYGSSPSDSTDAPDVTAKVESLEVDDVVANYLTITFQENLNAEGFLSVELSSDLLSWEAADDTTVQPLSREDNGDGTATVTVYLVTPVDGETKEKFVRLRGN